MTRRTRAAVVVALAATVLAAAPQPAGAVAVTVNLCALPGTTAPLPDSQPGTTIPIWGFAHPVTPGTCAGAVATAPGPLVEATVGDTVSISVTNALGPGHTLRFEAPGVPFDPGPTDAAPGTTVTRTFVATQPGTFLYQSAGDSGRQEAMGLYGLLVVRPTALNQAYGASTAYDQEALLVLSALDPAFNENPTTYDMYAYRATYWLINGLAYPDTTAILGTAGKAVLLRYANAGFDHTTMQLLGLHERVIARDGHPLTTPVDVSAETIPAGATKDAIVTVPPTPAPPSTHGFPLYNRQLHVTNGAQLGTSPTPTSGGGMLTFVVP
jgi:FtsP/CotA-like multicopper oxidase with cupredoxin domain